MVITDDCSVLDSDDVLVVGVFDVVSNSVDGSLVVVASGVSFCGVVVICDEDVATFVVNAALLVVTATVGVDIVLLILVLTSPFDVDVDDIKVVAFGEVFCTVLVDVLCVTAPLDAMKVDILAVTEDGLILVEVKDVDVCDGVPSDGVDIGGLRLVIEEVVLVVVVSDVVLVVLVSTI